MTGLYAAENSPASTASSVEFVRGQVNGGGRVAVVSAVHHHNMLSSCSIIYYRPCFTTNATGPANIQPDDLCAGKSLA